MLYLLPRVCFLHCLWLSILARFNKKTFAGSTCLSAPQQSLIGQPIRNHFLIQILIYKKWDKKTNPQRGWEKGPRRNSRLPKKHLFYSRPETLRTTFKHYKNSQSQTLETLVSLQPQLIVTLPLSILLLLFASYLSLPPTRHDLTQGQKPKGRLKWG